METILKDLTCYKVVHFNDDKKIELRFLDEENNEIYKVAYNKQKYSDGNYIDDPETAAKAEALLEEETGFDWNHIDGFEGEVRDIYFYGDFSKLHHVEMVEKFKKEQAGELFDTTIKEVKIDNFGIHILYDWDGDTYKSNMSYGDYENNGGKMLFLVDPSKKARQKKAFEDKYGVPVELAESLVGKSIKVEVISKANGKILYGEIKKPKWGKK